MPRVSIAMPAYNCERYIAQSLESLLGQTFGDFELVISDNASTDGTEQICRDFAARDTRIRYVRRTQNIGGPGNFRYVFSLCTGAYHKWSTADDYWDPTFLEKGVAVLDANPDVVLCYPKTQLIGAEGQMLQKYEDPLHLVADSPAERFRDLFARIGLCNAHLGVIRRAAMERTSLIGAEVNSDTHFLAEMTLYGKFWLLPEYLFFRRFHEASSSWSREDTTRQQAYYDPSKRSHFGMHAWRKYKHLSGGVWKAPVSPADKASIYNYLLRSMLWDRRSLGRELLALLSRNNTARA